MNSQYKKVDFNANIVVNSTVAARPSNNNGFDN